jgi:hypothetical protein
MSEEKIKRPQQKKDNPVPKPRKPRKKPHPKFAERCVSRIEKYNLMDIVVRMKRKGESYSAIARHINESGLLPEGLTVNVKMLSTFMTNRMPEIKSEIIKSDQRRLLKAANTQLDIMAEVNNLYIRTKNKLFDYEQNINTKISPKEYKALCSEMRELLKQVLDLQKEVLNFENIKMFMDIVLNTVKDLAPEALQPILDKLRVHKGTAWMTGKEEDE